MKRSSVVNATRTAAFAAGLLALQATMAACGDSPDDYQEQNSAYGEICMKYNRATGEYDVRVPDSECDNDTGRAHYTWLWINHGGGYHAPAVGSKLQPGSYTTTKPTGTTISRPPSTGGFGTFRVPTGG